ncbi:MAG: DUF1302 family protein [Candidatus Thiodiazotropha sp.]
MTNENCRGVSPCFARKVLNRGIKTVVTGSLLTAASAGYGLDWKLENGVTVDLDTSVTYDAQWRREEADDAILDFGGQGILVDDGNRNFDDGDMTQNRISFSTDLDINYGDGGLFVRARGWYDEVYNDDDLIEQSHPLLGAGTPKSFQQDGIDWHKSEIELLDAFVYHTFDMGDRSASVRLGQQVVNWGESLFVNGGISSAQAPVDATKANAPGVELKDIFLPLGQLYVELGLSENISMGAYYQYDWEETRIDAPGTYFGVDILGQESVGDTLDAVGLPVAEQTPDEGQYGIALRYLAEQLNNTEFALYYLEYNDFLPALQLLPPILGPQLSHEYFEDIKLIGLSFGTVFGDSNVSGELSYRDGQPVQLNVPGAFYFSEAETVQAQVSVIHLFGDTPLADNLSLTAEIGYNRVLEIEDDATAALLGIDVDDINRALDDDRIGAGATVSLAADYFSLANALDLKVTATYRNDFNGVSAVPFTFTEGLEQFSLKTDFTYRNDHSFGISYVWFLTNPGDVIDDRGNLEFGHLTADKDYLAAYYKYRF